MSQLKRIQDIKKLSNATENKIESSLKNQCNNSKLKELKLKQLEDNWNIPPVPKKGLREYKAENDKNCVRAQVIKFNKYSRIKALQQHEEMEKKKSEKTSKWINNVLTSPTKDTNSSISLPTITSTMNQSHTIINQLDVIISQKIMVREKLLQDLQSLIKNHSDLYIAMHEITELIGAIRFQTVEIIEEIHKWQNQIRYYKPFIYSGSNYLIKLIEDFNYLDKYDIIVEKFCFEFTRNPLAYRGGGDLLQLSSSFSNNNTKISNSSYANYILEGGNIDGLEIARLRNCEILLQQEMIHFNNFSHQKLPILLNDTIPITMEKTDNIIESTLENNTMIASPSNGPNPKIKKTKTRKSKLKKYVIHLLF